MSHDDMTPEEKEKLRQQKLKLVASMMETGISETDAHIVVDLMVQAKRACFEKTEEIARLAPPHLQKLVAAMTLDTITNPETRKDIEAALLETMSLAIFVAVTFAPPKERPDRVN